MTNNIDGLIDVSDRNETIQFADGGTTHRGTFMEYINKKKIILRNVLYVPEFKRNLMSIKNLCEDKYKVIFYNYNNKNLVSVYDENKNKIFKTKSNKTKIYKVWSFKNKLKYNNVKKKNRIQ